MTDVGQKALRGRETSSEELRVLDFVNSSTNKTASDDELDAIGGSSVARVLKRHGFLQELTT